MLIAKVTAKVNKFVLLSYDFIPGFTGFEYVSDSEYTKL